VTDEERLLKIDELREALIRLIAGGPLEPPVIADTREDPDRGPDEVI